MIDPRISGKKFIIEGSVQRTILSAKEKKMKKAKILTMILAFVLVICLTVMGTVAYLKASTDTPVENTFTAGKLFDDNTNFNITEHKATPDANQTGVYTLGSDIVTTNSYTLVPGQNVPKDPTVNVKELKASAYLFIEFIGTKPTGISYSVNSTNWTKLQSGGADVTGANGGTIYYHPTTLRPSTTTQTFAVLAGDSTYASGVVTVADNYDTANGDFSIKIYSYICQDTGFSNALAAWNAVFNTTT